MHAISGAVAIRRERQKREQRRSSRQARGSEEVNVSDKAEVTFDRLPPPKAKSSSLTAFHLGVVFILLGFLMIFSGMIPSSLTVDADWSKLLGAGVTFLMIGLVMVMVNRIVGAKEEQELRHYVSHRLSRTRSGHALCRDPESLYDLRQRQQHLQQVQQLLQEAKANTGAKQNVQLVVASGAGSRRASAAAAGCGSSRRNSNHYQHQEHHRQRTASSGGAVSKSSSASGQAKIHKQGSLPDRGAGYVVQNKHAFLPLSPSGQIPLIQLTDVDAVSAAGPTSPPGPPASQNGPSPRIPHDFPEVHACRPRVHAGAPAPSPTVARDPPIGGEAGDLPAAEAPGTSEELDKLRPSGGDGRSPRDRRAPQDKEELQQLQNQRKSTAAAARALFFKEVPGGGGSDTSATSTSFPLRCQKWTS